MIDVDEAKRLILFENDGAEDPSFTYHFMPSESFQVESERCVKSGYSMRVQLGKMLDVVSALE